MKLFVALIAVSFCVFSCIADAPVEEDDVLVLTDSNFDEVVNNADLILVEFYAPWCGHCKHLAPEYAKAAKELKKKSPSIPLAKVDCTVETGVANRFGVKGYPTLKVFRSGVSSEYKGPREAKGIAAYMEKQSGPSAKPIADKAAYDKFTNNYDANIIGVFPSQSGDLFGIFKKTADALREEFRFGLITDKSVADAAGLQEGVVIVSKLDKPHVYDGKYTVSDLNNFIYASSVPPVGELTKDNLNRYQKKNLPIVKFFFDVAWEGANLKRTNYYLNRIKKVQEAVGDKLSFAVLKKNDFKDELEKFGLSNGKEINVAIDDFANSQKYKFGEEFGIESVTQFVRDYLDGKLKSYIKSEAAPANNDGPVKIVTGENFNDIVMDPTKNVLIEFYAPWCGHCKKLEPKYNELGEKFKNNKEVVIAKMDATANDSPHPKYQAKGYPTIFFAPANDKENPIQYSGEREVAAMQTWIKNKSQKPTATDKDEL